MKRKKELLLVSIVLIIVGVIGAVATYSDSSSSMNVNEQQEFTQIPTAIEINSDVSDVEILPTSDNKVTVKYVGNISQSSGDTDYTFSAEMDGSTLMISTDSDDDDNWQWFGFGFYSQELTLQVYLPEEQYEALDISGSTGDIKINGVNIDEITVDAFVGDISMSDLVSTNVKASTSTGDFKINDLNVDGLTVETFVGDITLSASNSKDVDASTSTGDIKLTDISAADVFTSTFVGDITLINVDGDLTGETSTGDIKLSTKEIDRNTTFSTSIGDISIESRTAPSNVEFLASTSVGDIEIFDQYTGGATIGNGDYTVELSTSTGDIDVELD